jgi:hypothetical protein
MQYETDAHVQSKKKGSPYPNLDADQYWKLSFAEATIKTGRREDLQNEE